MITVLCLPAGLHADLLVQGGSMGPYQFVTEGLAPALRVEITARELAAPFVVREDGTVLLTTRLAEEMARYAGLTMAAYIRTVALCGIVQARALLLNPDMRVEEFRHRCTDNCVMSARVLLEEYFEVLESPVFCRGCRVFYGQLLPQEEVAALAEHIASITALLTAA